MSSNTNNQKDNSISKLRNKLSPLFTLSDSCDIVIDDYKLKLKRTVNYNEHDFSALFNNIVITASASKPQVKKVLSEIDDDYVNFQNAIKLALENIPKEKEEVISELTLILQHYSQSI